MRRKSVAVITSTTRSETARTVADTGWPVKSDISPRLVPAPYDFSVSTGRFRAFGVDLANLWYEGGLHRVVAGREVRIEAAPGGVDVEPLDAETRPVVLKLLGAEFELEPFYAWAARDEVLEPLVSRLVGFRPPIAPDPFTTLVSSITEL